LDTALPNHGRWALFTRRAAAAFLCALLVIACAQDLSSLTPFPCALDGTCPAGYDCTAEKQCEPAPTCAQGMVDCAGTCVVTASDPENCGMCGKPCAAPMMCCGGTCCSEASCCGAASGSQVCSDLQSDPDNCNQCGTVCPTNDACSGGVCKCLPPDTLCPSGCADTSSDDANCGGCGKPCTGIDTCQGGVCECERCGGTTCIDITTDVNNCGGCGIKSSTGFCVNKCPVPTAGSTCAPAPLCGCELGDNCVVFISEKWGCATAGTLDAGATCSTGQCKAGLTCATGPGGIATCSPYCSPDYACPSGEVCCPLAGSNDGHDAGVEPGGYACFQEPSCE
jgi:hypothetical protein